MKTEALKRFVKDQKIPINVLVEPYFSYFLNMYEPHFGTMTAYRKFEKAVEEAGGEDAFLDMYYRVRDHILEELKGRRIYQDFLSADMSKYEVKDLDLKNVKKTDVYSSDNVGKYFCSIDMRRANFQVMRLFDKSMVFDCDTYEEFISKFTDSEYIRESKYTRQVIFGNLNPKRQIHMEKYYMTQVLKFLLEKRLIAQDSIRVLNNDEIVLEAIDIISDGALCFLEDAVRGSLGIDVKASSFQLKDLGDGCFVKEFQGGSFEFKNVPSTFFAQVYKKYFNMPIEPMDKVFMYEGKLAQFI